jgi:hypothetical protein
VLTFIHNFLDVNFSTTLTKTKIKIRLSLTYKCIGQYQQHKQLRAISFECIDCSLMTKYIAECDKIFYLVHNNSMEGGLRVYSVYN